MTLTDFLLARYAEVEETAREAGPDGGEWFSRHYELPDAHIYGEHGWLVSGPSVEAEDSEWGKAVADHIARNDPKRVLRDIEAKRRILELHDGSHECSGYDHTGEIDNCQWIVDGDCSTVRLLGSVFSDHPDYREEWKP